MSKKEKLLEKLLSKPKPKDFTWDELVTLMKACGFSLMKNTGSRRKFEYTKSDGEVIPFIVHEPHPGNILKPYIINAAICILKEVGVIESETE